MNIKEKWIIVTNYNDYAVSNTGKVMNIRNKQMLKQYLSPTGYYQVQLSNQGKRRTFRVHKLVAIMFIENTDSCKSTINHINGIKTDNNCTNLEWCTPKENDYHARITGLKNQNKPVYIECIITGEKTVFESTAECSRFLNSNNGSINRVLTRKRNKHKGYYIKYL